MYCKSDNRWPRLFFVVVVVSYTQHQTRRNKKNVRNTDRFWIWTKVDSANPDHQCPMRIALCWHSSRIWGKKREIFFCPVYTSTDNIIMPYPSYNRVLYQLCNQSFQLTLFVCILNKGKKEGFALSAIACWENKKGTSFFLQRKWIFTVWYFTFREL